MSEKVESSPADWTNSYSSQLVDECEALLAHLKKSREECAAGQLREAIYRRLVEELSVAILPVREEDRSLIVSAYEALSLFPSFPDGGIKNGSISNS